MNFWLKINFLVVQMSEIINIHKMFSC
jgi:hypothetical protein